MSGIYKTDAEWMEFFQGFVVGVLSTILIAWVFKELL